MNTNAKNLAHSLRRIAQALESDGTELRTFADQLDALTDEELKDSPIHSNVTLLIGLAFNNSSWVASAESALHIAAELARGRD